MHFVCFRPNSDLRNVRYCAAIRGTAEIGTRQLDVGCPPKTNLVRTDGGKHENGLRMHIGRSLNGLQRRFASCRAVIDQRGSYEIDGCG
jgi:hypothetical protein